MLNINHIVLLSLVLLLAGSLKCNAQNRWTINADGGISWSINENVPHFDHMEMSGLKISTVLRYGVNADSSFYLNRSIIWPMLRTVPNNTHASLMRRFAWNVTDIVSVNGRSLLNEKVEQITLRGVMIVNSHFELPNKGKMSLQRILFPSVNNPAFCEKYVLKNTGETNISLEIPASKFISQTDPTKGTEGSYKLIVSLYGETTKLLKPGEEVSFGVTFAGYKNNESEIQFDIEKELEARLRLISELENNLVLETPDPIINTMFSFAKIRGAESIYATKGGLMHGPGGESYYAAIWANDQAEYMNPFFPFLGYSIGNQSAINSFEHFARFMNSEFKPIPSSIIAEGEDIWNGAGDRGDAAMIAYGAARYALARGDKKEALELWPLIEWCLEYCKRNLNEAGVVKSDTDELEGRFPAGDANLCTSSLYYDALISSGFLAKELGDMKAARQYKNEAASLHIAINDYFGATVEGFDTYRYYAGNDILRSWICIPLTMGIFEKKDGTIQALFSPRLWTENGLLTQAGTTTFWDRSTLYALRGVYAAGAREKATDYFKKYSQKRLLGDHVPYPIEAWPEGNQRHLSAESGLYCRIVTEGIFGIRPIGFSTFDLTPQLPDTWNTMKLKNIHAFDVDPFDIEIQRESNEKIEIIIKRDGRVLKTIHSNNGVKTSIKL